MLHSAFSFNRKEVTPKPVSVFEKTTETGFLRSASSPHVLAAAPLAYGNQAVLRMLGNFSSPSVSRQCKSAGQDRTEPIKFFSRHRNDPQSTPSAPEPTPEKPDCRPEAPVGSGLCVVGPSSSVCRDDGVYELKYNGNKCCTTECTARHEAEHKKDQDGWGCCKAYSAALKQPGVDRSVIDDKYFAWRKSAESLTECHAYTVGAACADELAMTKDCAGAGSADPCCQDIEAYKKSQADAASCYCAGAPSQTPPCPAF